MERGEEGGVKRGKKTRAVSLLVMIYAGDMFISLYLESRVGLQPADIAL